MADRPRGIDRRTALLCAIAVALALAAGGIAQGLVRLIALCTNLAFYGRISVGDAAPAGHHLGSFVILVPVLGGLAVGVLARYGSAAIRGHGIPEAMERVLEHESRIPARITILKPLSAAISIGTGGPFGAEGPIIATGSALGSVLGQLIPTTAHERKTLLAAGAAAGMSAIFGSPVSAVLLAVELLLFELSPRTVVPVSFAAATAAAVRIAWVGALPVFPMGTPAVPGAGAMLVYVALGGLMGLLSVAVTRGVYAVEDAFEKLPIHWMWWPAMGGAVVGVVGYFEPHTMGVGYDNIERIVSGDLVGRALFVLVALKFVSWVIALGSGTSGGTLAPLFTLGGGIGALLGGGVALAFPSLGVDPRLGALVGMAAMFAGASRALLASIVFAFETTRQPVGLLPLLGGCAAAYLLASLLMRQSIMTVKIERRGVKVPVSFAADVLEQITVAECATAEVVCLLAHERLGVLRARLAGGDLGGGRQGFPVVDDARRIQGVVTRRVVAESALPDDATVADLVQRPAVVAFAASTLRQAVDLMATEGLGRLPVVTRDKPTEVVGILTRSDVLRAYERHAHGERREAPRLSLRRARPTEKPARAS